MDTINPKDYLKSKGISYKEANGELITTCLFCDKKDHLYFNAETGQYDCKRCGEQGNLITLAKHLGDEVKDVIEKGISYHKTKTAKKSTNNKFLSNSLVNEYHNNLPDNIKKYLNDRGINAKIISDNKIGWGTFYGKKWITIPVEDDKGNYLFLKLRQDPNDSNNPNKYKFYPKGSSATIFGQKLLKENKDLIVICEGEFDCLLLWDKGVPAITSTAGAGTFKKEWVKKLNEIKKVYICFDNDESGKKGSERLSKLLLNHKSQIFKINLPDKVGDGGDITDYLINLKGGIDDLFKKYCVEILSCDNIKRIVKIEKPAKEIDYLEWRDTINNNFSDLIFSSEIAASIIGQLLIKDITNPFALVLVDVPSSGKTICINFFSDIEKLTYATDKFTPASFVSNAANISKEKLKEVDLLPRLQYKMFLIRDLATLFSKRDDDLNECLGILTRVLDGEGLTTDGGVHGQRKYTGEYLFMILAASTPIPYKVWKMMGSLGSRLFFLNMNSKCKTEEELAEQITTTSYKKKEEICRQATSNFLHTLWNNNQEGIDWNKEGDKKEYKKIIARSAKLLAKLRAVIDVSKDRGEDGIEYNYNPPVIEQPDRVNQLFYNLSRGHALICGRKQINIDDLKPIIELAIDSAPTLRSKLLKALLDSDGRLKTSEVETILSCSKPTALKEMKILRALGICYKTVESYGDVGQPEEEIKISKDFIWFLSDECKKIRN